MTASDEAKKALEGVTPGRIVQFHPSYCKEAECTPISDWDTSHDLSAILPNGERYRLGSMRHAADAAFFQWAREGVPALLSEIAAKDAEIARLKSDRPFIIGANHGYETAMEQVAEEARRYASCYAEATDGRNTFTLFAEWADRAALKGDTHE